MSEAQEVRVTPWRRIVTIGHLAEQFCYLASDYCKINPFDLMHKDGVVYLNSDDDNLYWKLRVFARGWLAREGAA